MTIRKKKISFKTNAEKKSSKGKNSKKTSKTLKPFYAPFIPSLSTPVKGAFVLVEALRRQNINVVFAYPGGANLEIFDALYQSDIKVIVVEHEQHAAHMAEGYARTTGKVGVCIATSGPGATNLITGIADAKLDSVPIVAITGQVASKMIGLDAFQETDVFGLSLPITKHSYLVHNAYDLVRTVKEAIHISGSGRPGPVMIDIPKDVQQTLLVPDYDDPMDLPGYKIKAPKAVDQNQIKKMIDAIDKAKRPLIYAGGGIISGNASEELRKFVRKTNIPVTTTIMGLGAFPETDPLALHMLGMHGSAYANYAVDTCDLLISLGVRFDDRVTGNKDLFAPNAKIIHVEIDPAEINKNIHAHIPVIGNVKNVLQAMTTAFKKKKDLSEWHKKTAAWKKKYPFHYKRSSSVIKPQAVLDELYQQTKNRDTIITTEVGQHQMWAAQFYQFNKPRRFITSAGLGTMGFGLPSALGAQYGNPKMLCVNIAGDGSLRMNVNALGTAHLNNLPVKVLILNNQYLGMVRQWQEKFYGKRYASTFLGKSGNELEDFCLVHDNDLSTYPSFIQIAAGYGIKGKKISHPKEIRKAIQEMISTPGPFVLDVIVQYEENVYPMIPAGGSVKDIIIG